MADKGDMIKRVLAILPQQPPFRFIDEILTINDQVIVSTYRFQQEEYFYRGHFPGNPVTPGVILIETMAQAGVAALGIYLMIRNKQNQDPVGVVTPLFVCADQVSFDSIVRPGERVIITGEKKYFRRGTIQSRVSIHRDDQTLICRGTLTGIGVTNS